MSYEVTLISDEKIYAEVIMNLPDVDVLFRYSGKYEKVKINTTLGREFMGRKYILKYKSLAKKRIEDLLTQLANHSKEDGEYIVDITPTLNSVIIALVPISKVTRKEQWYEKGE